MYLSTSGCPYPGFTFTADWLACSTSLSTVYLQPSHPLVLAFSMPMKKCAVLLSLFSPHQKYLCHKSMTCVLGMKSHCSSTRTFCSLLMSHKRSISRWVIWRSDMRPGEQEATLQLHSIWNISLYTFWSACARKINKDIQCSSCLWFKWQETIQVFHQNTDKGNIFDGMNGQCVRKIALDDSVRGEINIAH